MSRTTGFTATVVALRMLNGAVPPAGVWAPEALWADADAVLAGLSERGVAYHFSSRPR